MCVMCQVCTSIPSTNSTYLDLLIGGDSTEDDLCEALHGKHAETDPSYHLVVFHQCQTLVLSGQNSKVSSSFCFFLHVS